MNTSGRNHLLNYARRRVDEVIKPLTQPPTDLATLDRVSYALHLLRTHFAGLHIVIGPILGDGGEPAVDVSEAPR